VKLTPIRTLSIHCPLLFMDMTCKDINFYLAKFIVSMTICHHLFRVSNSVSKQLLAPMSREQQYSQAPKVHFSPQLYMQWADNIHVHMRSCTVPNTSCPLPATEHLGQVDWLLVEEKVQQYSRRCRYKAREDSSHRSSRRSKDRYNCFGHNQPCRLYLWEQSML